MRKYTGVVIGLLLSIFAVGTVLAEGSWDSSIINARRSFDSRTWTDNDLDNNDTTIRFETCRDEDTGNGSDDWATVSLQRMRGWLPAENRGQATVHCWTSATGNWGHQPGSDYQFQLDDYSGGTDDWNVFDVAFLRVSY